jgi:diguanylate cyclase
VLSGGRCRGSHAWLHRSGPEAEALAERLRAGIAALEFPAVPGLRCSISLGLAALGRTPTTLRAWFEAADRALYLAKRGGRDRVGRLEPEPVTAFD